MADLRVESKSLDSEFVATLSRILSSAGVPNLLWGNYLLTIYGVPTITDDVAFVVPDERIAAALSALKEAKFVPCAEGLSCPHIHGFHAPSPLEHLHISEGFAISLYQKSEVLWEFEDFGICQFEKSSNIISASDPRLPSAVPGRGQGRFSPDMSFVRIPSAVRFCEALILLLCRDYDTAYETYWLAILTYVLEYVDETDVFDGKYLREEYRKFYYALKNGDSSVYLLLDELRSDLTSKGRLPRGHN